MAEAEQAVQQRLRELEHWFPKPIVPSRRRTREQAPAEEQPLHLVYSGGTGSSRAQQSSLHVHDSSAASGRPVARLEDDDDDDEDPEVGQSGGSREAAVHATGEKGAYENEDALLSDDDDDSGFVVSEDGEPSEHSDSSQERTRVKDKHERSREQQKQLLSDIHSKRSSRSMQQQRRQQRSHQNVPVQDTELQLPVFGTETADEERDGGHDSRRCQRRGNETHKTTARAIDHDEEEEVQLVKEVVPHRSSSGANGTKCSTNVSRSAAMQHQKHTAIANDADVIDSACWSTLRREHNSEGGPLDNRRKALKSLHPTNHTVSNDREQSVDDGSNRITTAVDNEDNDDMMGFLVDGDNVPSEHSDGSQERTRVDIESRKRQRSNASRSRERVLDDLSKGRASSKRRIDELNDMLPAGEHLASFERHTSTKQMTSSGNRQLQHAPVRNWLASSSCVHNQNDRRRAGMKQLQLSSSTRQTRQRKRAQTRSDKEQHHVAGSGVRIHTDRSSSYTSCTEGTEHNEYTQRKNSNNQHGDLIELDMYVPEFDDASCPDNEIGFHHDEDWAAWQSDEELEAENMCLSGDLEVPKQLLQLLQEAKFAGLEALPAEACKVMVTQWMSEVKDAMATSVQMEDLRLLFSFYLRLARHVPEECLTEAVIPIVHGDGSVVSFSNNDSQRQALLLYLGVRILARCIKRGHKNATFQMLEQLLSMLSVLINELRDQKEHYIRLSSDCDGKHNIRLEAWTTMQEKATLAEQLLCHLKVCVSRVNADCIKILLEEVSNIASAEQRLRKSLRIHFLNLLGSSLQATLRWIHNSPLHSSESIKFQLGSCCDMNVRPLLEECMSLEFTCRRTQEDVASGLGIPGLAQNVYGDCLAALSASGYISWNGIMKSITFPLLPQKLWTNGRKDIRSLSVNLMSRIASQSVSISGSISSCMRPDHVLNHVLSALCDFTNSSEELLRLMNFARAFVNSYRSCLFGALVVPNVVSCKKLRERLQLQRSVMVEMLTCIEFALQPDTPSTLQRFNPSKIAEAAMSNVKFGLQEVENSSQAALWRRHNEQCLARLVRGFTIQLLKSYCGSSKTTPMLVRVLHRLLRRAQRAAKMTNVKTVSGTDFAYVKTVLAACVCEGSQPHPKCFSCLHTVMHMSIEAFDQASEVALQRSKSRIDIVAEGLVETLDSENGRKMCSLVLGSFVRANLENIHSSSAAHQRNALGSIRLLRGLFADKRFHTTQNLHLNMSLLFCPLLDALSSECVLQRAFGCGAVQHSLLAVLTNLFTYTSLLSGYMPCEEGDESSTFPNLGNIASLEPLDERTFEKALTAFVEGVQWACVGIVEEACGIPETRMSNDTAANARVRLNVLLGPMPCFQVFEENYHMNAESTGRPLPPTSSRRCFLALQCLRMIGSNWALHGVLRLEESIFACKSALERNPNAAIRCYEEFERCVQICSRSRPVNLVLTTQGNQQASADNGSCDGNSSYLPQEYQGGVQSGTLSRQEHPRACEVDFGHLRSLEGYNVSLTAYVTSKSPSNGYNSRSNPSTGRSFDLCKLHLKDENKREISAQLSGRLARSAGSTLDQALQQKDAVVVSVKDAKVTTAGERGGILIVCSPPGCTLTVEPNTARAKQLHAFAKQRKEAREAAEQASQQRWECMICGLGNELWRSVCKVCKHPR